MEFPCPASSGGKDLKLLGTSLSCWKETASKGGQAMLGWQDGSVGRELLLLTLTM